MNAEEKLHQLADDYGYGSIGEMLEMATYNSVSPAICDNCGSTAELEPDAINCPCEDCGSDSVSSCLVIAGFI